jgi:hypothetical protein
MISFLHNHNDQEVAAAPSRISGFKSFSRPHSQLPKILDTLRGWDKPKAACIIDHTAWEKRHSKKRCWIVSSLWQKQQTLLPCQLHFGKLSFVRITPLCKYHINIFIFKGAFNFHMRLFRLGYHYESLPSNEISLRTVHLDVGSIETHQIPA